MATPLGRASPCGHAYTKPMDRSGLELVRRWAALLLLAFLCMGTAASGFSSAFAKDAAPVQDAEELEAQTSDARLEECELWCQRPQPWDLAEHPEIAPSVPTAVRLRRFDGERQARGAFLPLLT